jgi:hypothetical protein
VKILQVSNIIIFSIDERTSAVFPALAFCFGFKPEFDENELLIPRNILRWKENQTIELMNSTFRKSTFDIEV